MIIKDINELISMWQTDCIIKEDATEITSETARIPKLVAKYLGIKTKHSLMVKKIEAEYREMTGLKRSYYSGEITDPEVLAKHGWEQWKKNKVLKSSMFDYLQTDADLISIIERKDAHQEVVDFCLVVLKELSNRTWQMRLILDTEKYFLGHG